MQRDKDEFLDKNKTEKDVASYLGLCDLSGFDLCFVYPFSEREKKIESRQ